MKFSHLPTLSLIACCSVFLGCATAGPTVLPGTPAIKLNLDREYSVIQATQKDSKFQAFMIAAKDDNSSGVIMIGTGGFQKTEASIRKEYGQPTKSAGTVNGTPISWWDYSDKNHLYSTGSVTLTDSQGKKHPFYFDLVANSAERMQALKKALGKISFE